MIPSRSRHAHLLLAFCLLLALVGTAGSARAAADPADVQSVHRSFVSLASLKIANPLQLAIWEAGIDDCLNNPSPFQQSPVSDCTDEVLPPAMTTVFHIVFAAQTVITGAWAEVDFTPTSAHHFGTIVIDNNHLGTLMSDQPGFATLEFYRSNDSSPAGGAGLVLTFDYIHYTSSMRDDAGYGMLIETFDGCKMYGQFYSINDPSTLGSLLFARC